MNLLPAALAAEAVRRTLLQRRRIRREADALAAEVGPLWGPIAPTTRHGDPDSDLYRLRGGDSFTDAAAARASALEGLVDDKEMVRVEIELRRLRGRVDAERDASLLARCVLETDDEQKARFQFLALEGQLETQAAEAWWRSQE